MSDNNNYCLVCIASINLLKPCEVCETWLCQTCYHLYRIKYNKHICASCRQPLPVYEHNLDLELKNAFETYMKKHIASADEELKYNQVLELITTRINYQILNERIAANNHMFVNPYNAANQHMTVNNYFNYLNSVIHAHHKQCEKVASAIMFMLIVCLLYIVLATACVLSKQPSYEQYMAFIPSGFVVLYIILKLCRLSYYIDYLTISKTFIEGFITGICLFYSAIVWNNAGTVFAILTWLLNGLSLIVIQSQHCSRHVV